MLNRSWILTALLACLLAVSMQPAWAEGGGSGARGSAGGEKGGPAYVRLRPISFSVIGSDNKINREVSIVLNLELIDGKNEQMLDPYRRQIQDAFLVALSDIWDSRAPDAPAVSGQEVKDKLFKAATDITGPGFIKSVLIIGIGERTHSR